jgi:hypothetical protein
MKTLLIMLCLLCVTVYFVDNSRISYNEATGIATDTGTERIISEYQIIKGSGFVRFTGDTTSVITTVPADRVKYITDECYR